MNFYKYVLTGTIIFFSFILMPSCASAQSLPSFTMQLTNGKIIASKEMLHKQPLLLIYFSPDCEHCQKLIDDILNNINSFKKADILLITFFPLKDAINFAKNYNIAAYPNITVATETQPLYLRKYFSLEHTPFTALYNNTGKLLLSYKNEPFLNELTKAIADKKIPISK